MDVCGENENNSKIQEAIEGLEMRVLEPCKKGRARILNMVDDDGNVIGRTLHSRLLQGLLSKAEIEAQVRDGVRPKVVACLDCRAPRKVLRGKIPLRCKKCTRKAYNARQREWLREHMKDPARRKAYRAKNAERQREYMKDPARRKAAKAKSAEWQRECMKDPARRKAAKAKNAEWQRECMKDPARRKAYNARQREWRARRNAEKLNSAESAERKTQ